MNIKNYVSATFDTAAQQTVTTALADLLAGLPFLIDLSPEDRRFMPKMGPKSQAFVEKCLEAAKANPKALSGSFDLAEFERDLALWKALQPIALKVAQLNELLDDTLTAVGSDLYTEALACYGYLKAAGNNAGLDDLKSQLSTRFSRRPAARPAAVGTP